MEKVSLEYPSSTTVKDSAQQEEQAQQARRFLTLDFLVFGYTAWITVFTAVFHGSMSNPSAILALHLFIMAVMLLVPGRGASWESTSLLGWKGHLRNGARFFRYTYPLLLVLFFFEEGHQTVNAMWSEAPHWFESSLYAADLRVFGELPAVFMNDWVGPVQDELIHMFYFSYYFIFVGGVIFAFFAGGDSKTPAPGFQTAITTVLLAFFLCFVWYPFLPARGPWENPELMAEMTPFKGFVFVPIIERIIAHGAVSGGCFPSSHVAGAWGAVLGLWGFHRRPAIVLGVFAVGMNLGCVYTRYHHAVDVAAGFTAAVVAAVVSYKLTSSESPAE